MGTGSTGAMSGGCCLVDTDKCAVVYVDGSSTPTYTNRILTFSGTTITQGATATQTFNIVASPVTNIFSVIKVRNTAYAWVGSTLNQSGIYIQTLSGTTITTNNTATLLTSVNQTLSNAAYLADNRIGIYSSTNGSSINNFWIFEINPASAATLNTYTHSQNLGATSFPAYLVRISDTEFAVTYPAARTFVDKISKPASGFVTVLTPLVDLTVINMPLVTLAG